MRFQGDVRPERRVTPLSILQFLTSAPHQLGEREEKRTGVDGRTGTPYSLFPRGFSIDPSVQSVSYEVILIDKSRRERTGRGHTMGALMEHRLLNLAVDDLKSNISRLHEDHPALGALRSLLYVGSESPGTVINDYNSDTTNSIKQRDTHQYTDQP